LGALVREFEDAHRRLYGFIAQDDEIQMISYRLTATGLVAKASFPARPTQGADATAAITGTRQVWMATHQGFVDTPLYDRRLLASGNRFTGPAIVDQLDTTTVIPPGVQVSIDPYLNMILEVTT
jgi:N-methylhydantoinase A